MAGHSQFKNIMHRKGRQDKVKSKVFGKLAREITVSAKPGIPDPAMNPRLRAAVIAARVENMPRDNIERAIKKATGGDAEGYDEIRYDGYGPGGVAVIVETLTDNRNRTAGEVRAAFTKSGGALGETNSVSFMFDRVGEISYPAATASADDMFEAVIEAGAENVESDVEQHAVTTAPEDLNAVRDALENRFGPAESARLAWRPKTASPIDEETAATLFKLLEALEDSDDVQNVYANFEVAEDVIARLGA